MIVKDGGTYVCIHESRLLRILESKAMCDNKTTDNIESDDSGDKDGRNTDAAGNVTENNDDFLRDVDEDSGATANIEQGRSASDK